MAGVGVFDCPRIGRVIAQTQKIVVAPWECVKLIDGGGMD